MLLPRTVRPSLLQIITVRLAITSILAILLQLTIVVARTYLNEDDLNRSYVTREARALFAKIEPGPQALVVPQRAVPEHYKGAHARSYAFRVLTDNGEIIAEHNGALIAQLSPWREKPSRTQDLWLVDLDTERKLYVAGGLKDKIGTRDVWIEVATWADPDRVYLGIVAAEVLDDVWMPMIPLIVLTLGVAVVSVRRSLGGLVRAAAEAEGISPMDRKRRFDASGMPREAAIFAVAINELLDRVGRLVGAQRMFIAKAAHELRTPLAVMMLELDRDSPRIDRLQADVRGMSETVERLLTLARLGSIEGPDFKELDVGQIVIESADRLRDWASGSQHQIAVKVREPVSIVGDAVAIRETIRNLMDNAVRHTPPGTQIQVTVGPGASITVEDNGPGLPGVVSDLLLPFKKGSPSTEGSGLGLAIVKQAVDLHHGVLQVGRSSSGGAKISILFPQSRAAAAECPTSAPVRGVPPWAAEVPSVSC